MNKPNPNVLSKKFLPAAVDADGSGFIKKPEKLAIRTNYYIFWETSRQGKKV